MYGGAVCYVPCSCMDRHLNSDAAIRWHAFNANESIENLDQTQHYYKKIFVLIVVRLRAIVVGSINFSHMQTKFIFALTPLVQFC